MPNETSNECLWQQSGSQGKQSNYDINKDQLLTFKKIIYVPNQISFRQLILDEFHKIPYHAHPGYHKMYSTIKSYYFWPRMCRDIAEYLKKYIEYQQVKAEHQHPASLFQPIPTP